MALLVVAALHTDSFDVFSDAHVIKPLPEASAIVCLAARCAIIVSGKPKSARRIPNIISPGVVRPVRLATGDWGSIGDLYTATCANQIVFPVKADVADAMVVFLLPPRDGRTLSVLRSAARIIFRIRSICPAIVNENVR